MNIVLLILFVFLITNNIFSNIVPEINFFDEGLTICALFTCICTHKARYILPSEKKMLWYNFVVVIIGCLSTIIYHIQPIFDGVWRDCLAIMKFPLCYYIYNNYTKDTTKENALKLGVKFTKIFIPIILLFGFINLIFHMPILNNGERYGLPLYSFFYTHNTFLIAATTAMLGVLTADGIKKNKKYIILGIIILLLTLRSKAMPVAFIMILILIIRNRGFRPIGKFRLSLFGIIGIFIALYISANRIDEYIGYADTSARGAFFINGILIANHYFPIGSGFCTFASSLSGKYYSPLYYNYNMQYIWGISEDDISYAGDTFWPNIYAQYGYLGLLAYLLMLLYLFKSINQRFSFFSDKWIAAILLFLYALSASTAESFFTNDSAVIFAMIMAIYLGDNNRNINSQQKYHEI